MYHGLHTGVTLVKDSLGKYGIYKKKIEGGFENIISLADRHIFVTKSNLMIILIVIIFLRRILSS